MYMLSSVIGPAFANARCCAQIEQALIESRAVAFHLNLIVRACSGLLSHQSQAMGFRNAVTHGHVRAYIGREDMPFALIVLATLQHLSIHPDDMQS